MSTTPSLRYGTGSEFGLSGADQIRIALKTMSDQGGVATMDEITAAVDQTLIERDPQLRLSSQGKASLRFFVNKVAVDAKYIYKHDSRRGGWTITPKGLDFIATSPTAPLSSKMLTPTGRDFQLSLADVYALLHAEKSLAANEAASAAYIRAGVILTVTAWETFVEDTLRALTTHLLEEAVTPDDVSKLFNVVALAWLDPTADRRDRMPPGLRRWTGIGWKTVIREHFEKEVATFNTPKSKNIISIFEKYAGFDIAAHWNWEQTTSAEACAKLDQLVSKRGDLVHRGRTSADTVPLPTRSWLIEMITLIEQMAWLTDLQVNDQLSAVRAS